MAWPNVRTESFIGGIVRWSPLAASRGPPKLLEKLLTYLVSLAPPTNHVRAVTQQAGGTVKPRLGSSGAAVTKVSYRD